MKQTISAMDGATCSSSVNVLTPAAMQSMGAPDGDTFPGLRLVLTVAAKRTSGLTSIR